MAARRAEAFAFSPQQGDVILVYTDGVDECSYRDPDHSITPEVMERVLNETGSEPDAICDAIVRLALKGVDGSPGGQDNIALAVTRV